MFSEGKVVILESCASGRSLRINEANIFESLEVAQFRVHVERPGVVALQNVHSHTPGWPYFKGRLSER